MARRTRIVALGAAVALVIVATAAGSTPVISYAVDGIVGTNGWYRGSSHGNNVVLHWYVSSNATSSDCTAAITVPGPTRGTTKSCRATNAEGTVTAVVTIKIDATPPTGVALHVSRSPDYHGWYNHPVSLSWTGGDATSGIAACSSVSYAGPDRAGAVVRGGCTDRAGNSTFTAGTINYDATAPTLARLDVASTAGADLVRWKSTSPSDRIVVRRTARGNKRRVVVFDGSGSSFVDRRIRPGIEYRYAIQAIDQAGNGSAEATVAGLPKVLTLQKTPYVPRAAPKPILRWARKPGARYYHVQLFRGLKRVLAAWPETHQLGLPAAWKWNGHRYRLRPGRYRWYVWAGLGARSFARYRTIGSAAFIVPR